MNGYARLSVVKSDQLLANVTSEDAAIVRAIEAESREYDLETGRFFYTQPGTYYYTARRAGRAILRLGSPAGPIAPPDIVSITTLTVDQDGDGIYETTLVADTDYWLTAATASAPSTIELNPNSLLLTTWPPGRRRVKLVGVAGFSATTEVCTVTAAEAMDASETGLDLSAAGGIDVGETILIDSEQMYVSAVTTTGSFTATVVRGVNGTTATTHLTAAPIYRRRYPEDIELAIADRVVAHRWGSQTGWQGGDSLPSSGGSGRVGYAQWMATIRRYKLPGVA